MEGQRQQGTLWSSKYAPCTVADLAMAAGKVDSVRKWLEWAVPAARGSNNGGRAQVLVLCGMCGCGKTALITVLAREMGLDLTTWGGELLVSDAWEWNNREWTGTASFASDGVLAGSQIAQFESFMQRAGYVALRTLTTAAPEPTTPGPAGSAVGVAVSEASSSSSTTTATARNPAMPEAATQDNGGRAGVIVIEELPSTNAEQQGRVTDLLCTPHGKPVIVMLTEDVNGQRSAVHMVERVMTPAFMQRANVHVVDVRPVTDKRVQKVLTNIAKSERVMDRVGGSVGLAEIASRSRGDLRQAIMTLQFQSCLGDSRGGGIGRGPNSKAIRRGTGGSRKRPRTDTRSGPENAALSHPRKQQQQQQQQKDRSYNLLHAVGKLLAASMDPDTRRLAFDASTVMDQSEMALSTAIAYLQGNCVDYFSQQDDGGVHDLAESLDMFSACDALYSPRRGNEDIVAGMAGRCTAVLNRHRQQVGFHPISRPRSLDIRPHFLGLPANHPRLSSLTVDSAVAEERARQAQAQLLQADDIEEEDDDNGADWS